MRTTTLFLCFITSMICRPSFSEETALGIDEKLKAVYDLYRVNDTVTLKRHEFNIGLTFGYGLEDMQVLGIQDTVRTLSATVLMSYGLTDTLQISLTTPFLHRTHVAEDATTTYLDTVATGMADATLGVAITLPTTSFSTTLRMSTTLPTGDDTLVHDEGTNTSIGFNIDKVMQPAFVYGGMSWVRDWGTNKDTVGYSAGVGFFLNYALSIGAGLEGGFALNPEQGIAHDTMMFVGRVSYQATPSFGFSPSLSFGLTENSPDINLGVAMLWRF